jgi:hypothetical protein
VIEAAAGERERARRRAACWLFATVAASEMIEIVAHGLRNLSSRHSNIMAMMAASTIAVGVWRGRRWAPVAGLAFGMLFAVFSVWGAAIEVQSFAAAFYGPSAPRVLALVAMRAIVLIAAAVVLLTGAPNTTRLVAGRTLAGAFALLTLAEYFVRYGVPALYVT